MKHPVVKFTSLKVALRELEPYVRNGQHLQTGKAFAQFGGLRSRELLANWLVCVVANAARGTDDLIFTSDPNDGDGVIYDEKAEASWPTEHVMVPELKQQGMEGLESRIIKAIQKKQAKGGAAYAAGKTLIVFLNSKGGPWYPNRISKQLPQPLDFDGVWIVGLRGVSEAGEYEYNVTQLHTKRGYVARIWLVRISKKFEDWRVVRVQ